MALKKTNLWGPERFELELTSVWDFPEHGTWATHDSKYRGNWSPYVPRNLILRYSKERDLILDQFAGGGTTLIEAKLLNRNSIGVDINPNAVRICEEKCNFEITDGGTTLIRQGDARNLDFIADKSIDFICTHPPYTNIIKYSVDIDGDLSLLPLDEFLQQMKAVAAECYRVLKPGKFCAILVGDIRKNGNIAPLSYEVMKIFENTNFRLKEIIIKTQHNCKATGYWKTKSLKYNFFLLAHEYLYVFKK